MHSLDEWLHRLNQLANQMPPPSLPATIVAVSKKQPLDKITHLYQQGQRHFAENYLQEGVDKISALDLPGLVWHFIGQLQSRKLKSIATHFDWVQSVTRLKEAQGLSEHRPSDKSALNLLLQVKLVDDPNKQGLDEDQAIELAEKIHSLPNIKLRGLMTFPPQAETLEAQRAPFAKAAQLFETLKASYPAMDTLSMGTSNDYQAAIDEGSTMIRIGTALFGPRNS